MAIPSYAMQTTPLALKLCDDLDKTTCRFLWSGNSEMHKSHLVARDTHCKSKEEGGVGLLSALAVNKAYLMKLYFRLFSESDTLWSRLTRGKYLELGFHFNFSRKDRILYVWKGILSATEDTLLVLRKVVGNGRNTKFWWETWVEDEPPLIQLMTDHNAVINKEFWVADWCRNNFWDIERLTFCLLERVVAMILALPPITLDESPDKWC